MDQIGPKWTKIHQHCMQSCGKIMSKSSKWTKIAVKIEAKWRQKRPKMDLKRPKMEWKLKNRSLSILRNVFPYIQFVLCWLFLDPKKTFFGSLFFVCENSLFPSSFFVTFLHSVFRDTLYIRRPLTRALCCANKKEKQQ